MLKKVKRYLQDPYYSLGNDLIKKHPKWMSDKYYLSVLWKMVMGYEIDWKHPKTFAEKIQWLKLNDHNPLYSVLVDKYRVKQWVAERIGEKYVIPTFACYRSVDEINMDELPDQFVLKCNHDSGSVVICRDKALFDLDSAKRKLGEALQKNFYWEAREWPYKDVPRCIFAEEYLVPPQDSPDLPDYKWYCFNGEPVFCQVIQNRSVCETIDFFDTEWKHQSFVGLSLKAENAKRCPEHPRHLDSHISVARALSMGIPFSRIDLFDMDEKVLFGEVTLFPGGGFGGFRPTEYDVLLGSMLQLPRQNP